MMSSRTGSRLIMASKLPSASTSFLSVDAWQHPAQSWCGLAEHVVGLQPQAVININGSGHRSKSQQQQRRAFTACHCWAMQRWTPSHVSGVGSLGAAALEQLSSSTDCK